MSTEANKILDDISVLIKTFVFVDDPDNNIIQTMDTASEIANADGCFFYELTPDKYLNMKYCNIKSLNSKFFGIENQQIFPSVFIPDSRNKALKSIAETCCINEEIINTPNIFIEKNIDTTNIKSFDERFNYSTISVLAFPIYFNEQKIFGVAQFVNARDNSGKIINFSSEHIEKMSLICQLLSLPTEKKHLSESYSQLLEAFINIIAKSIDDKSAAMGLHCQKVPIIVKMLATAIINETDGPLKDFDMTEDEWYSLHIASWLHDCGKITTPECILEKSTKLQTMHNRIHEIRNRFEILRRDAHIEYLQKRLQNTDTKENLQAEFLSKIAQLTSDFEFIGQCNIGEQRLTEEDIRRIDKISSQSFTRYFSRIVGLSYNERQQILDIEKYSNPNTEYLLQDLPEEEVAFYDQREILNLKTPQGTINNKERDKIKEHVVNTVKILKNIPFPQEYGNIVEYAGSHHERIDGKGYPNGITGDQMSIPAKILAVADIFEALTARDRPYKEPKKMSQVLRIMQEMKNTGHLDPDVYEVFIKSGVYMEYAKEYMEPNQLDEFNPEEFL